MVAFIFTVSLGTANAFADGSEGPSTPSFYTENEIDFEAVEDGDKFGTTWLGWQVNNGKYSATDSWATTYYNQELDLTKTIRIAFDFCLQSPATEVFDGNMQFIVALGSLDDINTSPSVHIHNSQNHGIYLNTLSDFSGVNSGWKADNSTNYFDGVEHTFIIAIEDSKIKFYVDGVDLYPDLTDGVDIPATNGHVIFQATDTAFYIDNLSITEASVDVSVKDFEEDLSIDFTALASSDAFYGLSGAWKRYEVDGNGILKPVAKWNSTRFNTLMSGNFTFSVDVHVELDADPNSNDNYFRLGIMQPQTIAPYYAGGYTLVYSKTYGMCLYDDGGLLATPLINDNTNLEFGSGDGNFNVTVIVWEDTLTIKINDNYYYGSDDIQNEFGIEEGFFTFEASNTSQCIDNVRVTKLSESPYPVPEPEPEPDDPDNQGGNSGSQTPSEDTPIEGKLGFEWWWIVLLGVSGLAVAGLAVYLVIALRKKK
jgi:hypothetical protein